MIINKPYIETRGDETFLISQIKDEVANIEKDIFYSVPNEYGKYLCDEVADAFVVAMLLPALVSGQNIKVNAPISEILYYQIENNLIYTLSKVFEKKPIKVLPKSTFTPDYTPTAVATGFSGGIDSLTTFINFSSKNIISDYQLSHLTLFNVGAYGNKEESNISFQKDLKRAKEFSQSVNFPIISLNSNICSYHNYKDIFAFGTRFVINIASGVLALQKLIKSYLISSGYPIEYISIRSDKKDNAHYDTLLGTFLSTTKTKFIITELNKNRVEKTRFISENPLAQKYLYVCAADVYNEKYDKGYCKDTAPNCSECDKCMRTMLTLDLLGALDKFKFRFDLNKYMKPP